MAQCCGLVPSPVVKVYRLKEARKRNIQPLKTLLTKPGNSGFLLEEDDTDSGISSHGNTMASSDFSKAELISRLSSASLKNPAYIKARILFDFKTSRPGTELSVEKGENVYLLYREQDKVLVINSEGKRGFIPLRYCSLLNKKRPSASRIQKQLYNDPSFKNFLTGMDRMSQKIIPRARNSNSRGYASNDLQRERPNMSSSSEEDSDYSFRGTSEYSGVTSRSRKSPAFFHERQKTSASFFRKGEETKTSVLYDFIARDENDISVYKGETITVLNREDVDWWWIATPEGYEGFVPKSYLNCQSSDSSEASTLSSSMESSSSTSEGSSTQVRFQDPLCTFHRYEKEEWEFTDSEMPNDNGYHMDEIKKSRGDDSEKSRWSTWC